MERLFLRPEAEDEVDDAGNHGRLAVLMLSPINPAPTGNGLAMRVHMMAEALARHHDVHLVVVGLSPRVPAAPSLPRGVVAVHELPLGAGDGRTRAIGLLSDPVWRDRLPSLIPLPDPLSFASPARSGDVTSTLNGAEVIAVVALRLSTALLGTAVAERLGVPLIVDADDDDVDLLLQQGRPEEAAAWERLGSLCFRSATLITVAGQPDRDRIRRRYGLASTVVVVPNAVTVPPPVAQSAAPGGRRLLFLANLRYEPNVEATRWLVGNVMPLLGEQWSVDLVGPCSAEVEALGSSRVVVHGWVEDVGPAYSRADVAAVPIIAGSGTRIKVLEAMAYGRPVVSTTAGCVGIDVVPGRDLLVADQPQAFARHIISLEDPELAVRLGRSGRRLVERRYDSSSVIDSAARLFWSVTGRDEGPRQSREEHRWPPR